MLSLFDRFNRALADWLVRGRVWFFFLGLAIVIVSYLYLFFNPLTYNRSMEGFFPPSEPRLQLYLQNKEWFGGEGTLLVVYRDPALWTNAGMERQRNLQIALQELRERGVKAVASLSDSPLPKQPWTSIRQAMVNAKDDPKRIEDIKEQIRGTPLYFGVFVAKDFETTALVVQLQARFDNSDQASACLEAVRATVQTQLGGVLPPDDGPFVAGTLLMIHDVYQYTEQDGDRLMFASVILMGLVIAVSFRSIRWLLAPLLVILGSFYLAEAMWALWRGELTMVSSAISSLVAVIGVSTVVHYGMHFRELRHTMDAEPALRQTLIDLGAPIFWIVATTAAGFGALLVCELKPVLDFAWIMLIASSLAGVFTLLFVPFIVMGFHPKPPREMPGGDRLNRWLLASLHFVQRRPWLNALGLIVPATFVSLGMIWLTPQTDFTGNFKQNTDLFRSYDFIETRFGGAGQLDLVFNGPDLEKLPTKELTEFLAKLRKLERDLGGLPPGRTQDGRVVPGVTKVLGLVDFLDFFDSTAVGGGVLNMKVRLLLMQGRLDEAKKEIGLAARLVPNELWEKFKNQPPVVPSFWNRAAGKMKLTLQVRERLDSQSKQQLIAAAKKTADEVLGPDAQPQTTGIYVMLSHLIESLLDDQNATTVISLVCQFLMGVMAFRSIWLAVITMVPTVLPVVAVVGTMGWIGLPVNIATAMLASVAMGMTIDGSLPYIMRFNLERQLGADFETALERTHTNTGLAVIIANIALVLGFGVLVLSRFKPLIHFGLFTGLALFGGVVGNLVLLPLLLSIGPEIKKRWRWRKSG